MNTKRKNTELDKMKINIQRTQQKKKKQHTHLSSERERNLHVCVWEGVVVAVWWWVLNWMEKVSGWHLNCGSKHDILLHSSYYFGSCCSFSVKCLRLLEASLYVDRWEREGELQHYWQEEKRGGERRRGVLVSAVLAIKKWIRGREKEGLTACLEGNISVSGLPVDLGLA